jgi:hypothetical protein
MSFSDDFVPDPEDQNARKEKGEIEAYKPRKGDGYHGLESCAHQSMRTRPQVIMSAGLKRRAMIQIRPASSLIGSPEDSTSTQCRGIPSGPTPTS